MTYGQINCYLDTAFAISMVGKYSENVTRPSYTVVKDNIYAAVASCNPLLPKSNVSTIITEAVIPATREVLYKAYTEITYETNVINVLCERSVNYTKFAVFGKNASETTYYPYENITVLHTNFPLSNLSANGSILTNITELAQKIQTVIQKYRFVSDASQLVYADISPSSPSSNDDGLSAATIAGIVVGVVAPVAIVATLVGLYLVKNPVIIHILQRPPPTPKQDEEALIKPAALSAQSSGVLKPEALRPRK
jgi:hypothetical protein